MRLVHLADLHLGFRQYQRLAPGGQNQREADVAETFRRTIDRVVALAPDLVVVAGDVFHFPRPTNAAILLAFSEFSRLTRALPATPVVVVAGNHDTPRTTETSGILQLLAPLGVHVVDRDAKRLVFPALDVSVLAVPDAGAPRPVLAPDAAARFNVLVLHGEIGGMLRGRVRGDRPATEIPAADLRAAEWTYVALGHYHVHQEVGRNAFYSGSIDYTSSNPWGELDEQRALGVPGKGIVERDLSTGAHRFHPLAPARPLVDLPPIDADERSVAELDVAIHDALEACPNGVDGKIVRLVVRNVPRYVSRALDAKAIREFKRRATSLRLDLRVPTPARPATRVVPMRTPTIDALVAEHLTNRFVVSGDVDRGELMGLAAKYLDEAREHPARTSAEEAA